MDDLKLFVKDDDNLEGQLQTVKNFINDTGIKFWLDKHAKATYERRLIKSTSVKLENKTTIKELKKEEVYKYLTAIESIEIQHGTMREKIRDECYWRVWAIIKTELNLANWIEAANALAISVVTYTLSIVNWTIPDIKKRIPKYKNF